MGGGEESSTSISFSCKVEFPQVEASRSKEVMAMASLKAPVLDVNDEDKRPATDIILVIDKSGSMAGAKLNLTKSALDFVVDQLDDRDNLALVTYDTNVSTDLELTRMTKENKAKAKQVVKDIQAGSMTNLSGGLLGGMSIAEKRVQPNKVCSVLLFTDGLANVGITQVNALTAATEKKLALCQDGTTVFTFGFGGDHDANMLRSISTAGKGMYYFIESVDKIPSSFADALGGLQSVVAQNIKLTVEAINGSTVNKPMTTTFKTTGTLPGPLAAVNLGDLYSEEERDILFSFQLPPCSPTDNFLFVTLTLEYFNVITTSDQKLQAVGSVFRTADIPVNQTRNISVDMQLNRLAAAAALEESRRLADQGKLEDARMKLEETKLQFTSSPSAAMDYTQGLEREMNVVLESMKSSSEYQSKGRQMMFAKAQSHNVQRSNEASLQGGAYENKSKAKKKAMLF